MFTSKFFLGTVVVSDSLRLTSETLKYTGSLFSRLAELSIENCDKASTAFCLDFCLNCYNTKKSDFNRITEL